MTIIQAIQRVLSSYPEGLTSKEIHEEIVKQGLYYFPAKNPRGVVSGLIRRHCAGLDFPTANPTKYFKIISYQGKKPVYSLVDIVKDNEQSLIKIIRDDDLLVEEKIKKYYDEHIKSIYNALLENILANSPSFFEHLVVDLMLKMGYGKNNDSGKVVGGPYDNGIDGIIMEDELGLDLIYLQAKRYAVNKKVGRAEIQSFVGAMKNVQKASCII